ncbi:MAG: hypothetical protein IJW47_02800 [Clostridia bacterium]|nr:hypothetical protein [Clostridia bacterium]
MKYLLKLSIIPIVYLLFEAMIALGILTIGDNLLWLKIVLSILNLGLYAVIVWSICFKEGEKALKVRLANDLERMQIIRTGEDRPLKLKEEYKTWKGFAIGLITCAPMVILLIVHTILISVNPAWTGAGAIVNFVYLVFNAFIHLNLETTVYAPWQFYFNLIALIIIPLITGISYMLGAKKIELQQEKIREKQRQIYGDNYNG